MKTTAKGQMPEEKVRTLKKSVSEEAPLALDSKHFSVLANSLLITHSWFHGIGCLIDYKILNTNTPHPWVHLYLRLCFII